MATLHTLRPGKGATKKRKRVGRGGNRGTFSTRGVKGQKARSGYSRRFGFEGGNTSLFERLPKFKGEKGLMQDRITITLTELNKHFEDGETVSARSLRKARLIPRVRTAWKVVNTGELTKKLKVTGGKATAGAVKAIEKAGGSVTIKEPVKQEKETSKE